MSDSSDEQVREEASKQLLEILETTHKDSLVPVFVSICADAAQLTPSPSPHPMETVMRIIEESGCASSRPLSTRVKVVLAVYAILRGTCEDPVWESVIDGGPIIEASLDLLAAVGDEVAVQDQLNSAIESMAFHMKARSTPRVLREDGYGFILSILEPDRSWSNWHLSALLSALLRFYANQPPPVQEPVIAVSLKFVEDGFESIRSGAEGNHWTYYETSLRVLWQVVQVLRRTDQIQSVIPNIFLMIEIALADRYVLVYVIDILIEFSCLSTPGSSGDHGGGVGSEMLAAQCDLIHMYLDSGWNEEDVTEDSLLLVEISMASVDTLETGGEVERVIGPIVELIQTGYHPLDRDHYEMLLDAMISAVCGLAATHPATLIRLVTEKASAPQGPGSVTYLIENLLVWVVAPDPAPVADTPTWPQLRIRVLQAVMVLLPSCIDASPEQGLQHLRATMRLFTEFEANLDIGHHSSPSNSWRTYDAAKWMAVENKRDIVVESVRGVNVEAARSSLDSLARNASAKFPEFCMQ